MFCSNCGKELGPGDIFCSNCGQKVNSNSSNSDSQTASSQATASSQPASSTQQSISSPYDPYKKEAESCKPWLIAGLVANILNFVPYLNCLSYIPAIVLTIVGMNLVIGLVSKIDDADSPNIYKQTKRLRLHYIIANISTVFMIIGFFIFIIVLASISEAVGDSKAFAQILLALGVIFIIAYFVYLIFVTIWSLVHWIKVNDYLSKIS